MSKKKKNNLYFDANDPIIQGSGYKSIRKINGMRKFAPRIQWGKEFQAWDQDRQLRYAQRLASTMNHAADILQKERNQLLEICKKQEAQIEQMQEQYLNQGNLMHGELASQNTEKQVLYAQIVNLTKEIKQLKLRIKELENGN